MSTGGESPRMEVLEEFSKRMKEEGFSIGQKAADFIAEYGDPVNLPVKQSATDKLTVPNVAPTVLYLFQYEKTYVGPVYNFCNLFFTYMTCDKTQKVCQLSGYFSLINMMIPDYVATAETKNLFMSYGYELVVQKFKNPKQLFEYVTVVDYEASSTLLKLVDQLPCDDVETEAALIMMDDQALFPFLDITTIDYDLAYSYAYQSILLLFMFKNITANNYLGWFNNRWRTFTGVFGMEEVCNGGPSPTTFPDVESCSSICRLTGTLPFFRRDIFDRISKLSHMRSNLQKAMYVLLSLVRGTELGHLALILEYIIKRHPGIMRLRALEFESRNLFKALDKLSKLDNITAGHLPYVKILYPPRETACINRQNFPNLIYVARKIGAMSVQSLNNYRGTDPGEEGSPIMNQLKRIIEVCEDVEKKLALKDPKVQREMEKEHAATKPVLVSLGALTSKQALDDEINGRSADAAIQQLRKGLGEMPAK